MTTSLDKAVNYAEGLLGNLQCAERIIRHLRHQLGVCDTITKENSELDSLVSIGLEVAMNGGDWIKDTIESALVDMEAFYPAPQNAQPENVARESGVQP